ncbi:MAG TPA: vitamin K epoxide reductase family protein [Roseiflexaceae bacterium]|nr:vitamin K epoxide reductase family protein [Roseiflexaceae bacterium]
MTPDLTRRRWIVGLSMVGAAMAQAVTLYQTGIIKHLPDPPIPYVDSSKVDAAPYAYSRFNAPDGPLMLITYGVTGLLAAAGGKDRATQQPWLPLAMALKVGYDAVQVLRLAREEWSDTQAFCAYCQLATLASLISAGLAAPEALRALRVLLAQSDSELAQHALRAISTAAEP